MDDAATGPVAFGPVIGLAADPGPGPPLLCKATPRTQRPGPSRHEPIGKGTKNSIALVRAPPVASAVRRAFLAP
ncbi:hypothetical protein MRX96_041866 [Rhipicephalus microplus]